MAWGPVEFVREVGSCEPIICFWVLADGLCEALCAIGELVRSWEKRPKATRVLGLEERERN